MELFVDKVGLTDLTEDSVETLLQSGTNSLLREALEQAGAGIWAFDADVETVYVNEALGTILGYTTEEILGRAPYEFMDAEERRITERNLERRKQQIAETHHFKFIHQDGHAVWTSVSSTPISIDGEFGGVIAIIFDITERYETQAALIESEKAYRVLAENSSDMISRFDTAGNCLWVSPTSEKLFGWRPDEWIGCNTYDYFHPEDILTIAQRHRQVLGNPDIALISYRLRCKDGTYRWVESTVHTIRDPETDEIIEIQSSTRDIDDRKRAEDQVLAAKEAAEAALSSKDEFLTTVSHEIRTPMTSVLGMSEILLDTDLDGEQREFAEAIHKGGERLMSVINEILDFSKIGAGETVIATEPIDVRARVEEVANLVRGSAMNKSLAFDYTIAPDVPDVITGDANRLCQVLHNLLGNAVKFTATGSVALKVELDKTEIKPTVRFEVKDTGIGITPNAASKIFDSFTQADSSTTREYGGTGLGLAISKQLVELMDGEISFESQPNIGSTFAFTVPVAGQS